MSPSESDSAAPRPRLFKRLVFALLPTLVLLGGAEGAIRLWGLANPTVRSMPLPGEYEGLFRSDDLLMWSIQPGTDLEFQGARVTANSLGIRGEEIGAKAPGEFRILSLGESTTFGPGVPNDGTYTARLGELLREADAAEGRAADRVQTINGGVPAYSSFQSLLYLQERGVELEPDLVLFYHQVNDYLPSSLRTSSNDEVGLSRSDRQIHESRHRAVEKWLGRSALFRFLSLRMARARIEKLQEGEGEVENPLFEIGLPDIGLGARTVDTTSGIDAASGLSEKSLPTRVTRDERRQNFEELAAFCDAEGIRLLVIHPSYRESRGHEKLLVDFCEEKGVAMFDALPVLHPEGVAPEEMFRDAMHPSARGHEALAQALARRILTDGLHRDD